MAQYELSLRDYWRVVRRRRWVILLVIVAIFIPTMIYINMLPSLYQASAQVQYIERKTRADLLIELYEWAPADPMKRQCEIIRSDEVIERAAIKLELIEPRSLEEPERSEEDRTKITSLQGMVATKIGEQTGTIDIMVTSHNPISTWSVANAVAYAYKEYNLYKKTEDARVRRDTTQKELAETEHKLREAEEELRKLREKYSAIDVSLESYHRLEDLQKERTVLLRRYTEKHPEIIRIDEEINRLREQFALSSIDITRFSQLMRDIDIYTTQCKDLKTRLSAAIIEAEKASDVEVLREASLPSAPIKPNKMMNLLTGLLIGLMLGLAAAFVMEHLETSIGTIEEIESLLKLPVLGVIPYLETAGEKPSVIGKTPGEGKGRGTEAESRIEVVRKQLILNYSPLSPTVEAYRILRTNVTRDNGGIRTGEPKPKTILITSTGPVEGKTITSINLAITMAQKGERILLVDTDMRKPFVHKVFGVEKEPGLSDLLMGTAQPEAVIRTITDTLIGGLSYEVIMKTPGIDNLHFIMAGNQVSNAAELLSSIELETLWKQLGRDYDYILLDCPPVLPVTDVMIIGPKVTWVVIVYRAGRTAKHALVRAKEDLVNAHIRIKGIILNYMSPEIEIAPSYYYHYYKYYPSKKS